MENKEGRESQRLWKMDYAENLRAIRAISEIEQAELFALHDLRNYIAHYQVEPLREIEDQAPAAIHLSKGLIEMTFKRVRRPISSTLKP